MEIEAATGAHNNQPTNDSNMAAEMAIAAVVAVTAATTATVTTVVVQRAAAAMAAREIYIKKGQKRRSWRRRWQWR